MNRVDAWGTMPRRGSRRTVKIGCHILLEIDGTLRPTISGTSRRIVPRQGSPDAVFWSAANLLHELGPAVNDR
jgi:hypothetical protein